MGYIREPKNIDLVVAPSKLTEETKHAINEAIAKYRKTGKIPVSANIVSQSSVRVFSNVGSKTKTTYSVNRSSNKRKLKA